MPKFTPLSFHNYNWKSDSIVPEDVLAPPYDVLSTADRKKLAGKNPFNAVNIDLPDTYKHAAELIKNWKDKNILIRHDTPVFLIQSTEYKIDGRQLTRWGILGGMEISPYGTGNIFPHEQTYPKAKKDRLALTRSVQGQLSPIFGVFDDPDLTLTKIGERVSGMEPEMSARIGECRHALWIVPREFNARISRMLSGQNVFIADGHHRYETALNFKKEQNQTVSDAPWNYVFTYLSNISSPGLEIFPYHRVLSFHKKFALRDALANAREYLTITELEGPVSFPENAPANSFILFLDDGAYHLSPKLKQSDIFDEIGSHILNHYFLEKILGLTDSDLSSGEFLAYTHSKSQAMEKVKNGNSQAAFLLNPVPMQTMRKVCCSGRVMPRKSTFFYPKLPTGLAFYLF
ncbi:MAG: DUF1015 family protein [Thermodesulfobacteriota bacterium]